MKKLLLAVAALALSVPSFAQTQTGTGGTLDAPVKIGQSIVVTGVTLTDGSAASLTCPITSFGYSTYAWNWQCAGGSVVVEGDEYPITSGKMTRSCSGGGRAHPTTCFDVFTGMTAEGPVYATSKGGTTTSVKETIEPVVGFQVTY